MIAKATASQMGKRRRNLITDSKDAAPAVLLLAARRSWAFGVRYYPTSCRAWPHKFLDEGVLGEVRYVGSPAENQGDFRAADLLGGGGPGQHNQTFVQRICTEGR